MLKDVLERSTAIWRSRCELLYHFSIFSFYLYVVLCKIPIVPGMSDTYGGHTKYFTVLNLYLTIVYFGFATYVDIKFLILDGVGGGKSEGSRSSKVRVCAKHLVNSDKQKRDYVFSSMLYPVSVLVTLMYWGVYAIDPNLIVSPKLARYEAVHGFANHAKHTAPTVTTVLESLTVRHKPPTSFTKGILGWVLYALSYIVYVHWIAYKGGFWVYPLLEKLAPAHRMLFFAGMFTIGCVVYQVGVDIIRVVWKTNRQKQE